MILISTLLAMTTWCGTFERAPGPTVIDVGAPVVGADYVRVPITITNPDCCSPMSFDVPGFDPAWGTYSGASLGMDWEVVCFSGIEYLDVPFPIVGKMACGWYAPAHDGQLWPTRYDIGSSSGNYWLAYTYLQGVQLHTLKGVGTIGYAYNDNGVFPHGAADGVYDFAGTSGANHVDKDPLEPLSFGAVHDVAITPERTEMVVDCTMYGCWTASIIWTTALTLQTDAVLHMELRYALNS